MVHDVHKPDRRGLDFDGKVLKIRSSSRAAACWRSWYAATLRRCLLSSVVSVTVQYHESTSGEVAASTWEHPRACGV